MCGIKEMVGCLPNERERRNFYIYRVPDHIRNNSNNYYVPRVVSIGPYHRGQPHLQAMEELKRRYLADFLSRSGRTIEDFIHVLTGAEPVARRCYFESVDLGKEEFVAMLLLDGCFIIELLIKFTYDDDGECDELLPEWIKALVKTDLLMLENQIPFPELKMLYDIAGLDQGRPSLAQLALHFLLDVRLQSNLPPEEDKIDHLLHLYHHCFVPRLDHGSRKDDTITTNQIVVKHHDMQILGAVVLVELTRIILLGSFNPLRETTPHRMIQSATELKEFGVEIHRDHAKERSFLDVNFSYGFLRMPRTVIDEATRSNYMNLVAFEQCSGKVNKDLTSYAVFMNCMISKPQDVVILQREGIIENKLPNEEEVVNFFNDLRACAYNYNSKYFKELFDDINRYCAEPLPNLRARIIHNYHSSQWTIVSMSMAIILLFCSIYQVIMASLSYSSHTRN